MSAERAEAAADCPNCYTEDDDETDCPHLLEGSDCPVCGHELHKPRGGKVECERCRYVVNGQNMYQRLRDFNVTVRQGKRILDLFDWQVSPTPGGVGNQLRGFCHDNDIEVEELNDVLADLCRLGDYSPDDEGDS